MISAEQLAASSDAIRTRDYLTGLLREIERLHRVVFHDLPHADWDRARESAEQILIAEIINRHHGDPESVRRLLDAQQERGHSLDTAIKNYAGAIHSYFTTPLGVALRYDLFGDTGAYLSPVALDWIRIQRGRAKAASGKEGA